MEGERATEPTEIDIEGFPAIGVPGGLALETDDGIRLWYPDGRASDLRLAEGPAFVTGAAGDLLAYCPSEPCTEILIVDLVTERSVTITGPDPIDPHSGRFSPDGSQLAVTTFTDDVILADTATGEIDTVAEAVESENAVWRLAWAPGRHLFANYATGLQQATIVRYDLDSRTADEVTLPFRAGSSFVVVARSGVGSYLQDQDQEPAACPPLGGMRSGRPATCGFGF